MGFLNPYAEVPCWILLQTPFLSDLRRLERENQALMMPPMSVRIVPKDTVHHRVRLMAGESSLGDTLRARWVTLRARWVAR
jgi:hypothetical protein